MDQFRGEMKRKYAYLLLELKKKRAEYFRANRRMLIIIATVLAVLVGFLAMNLNAYGMEFVMEHEVLVLLCAGGAFWLVYLLYTCLREGAERQVWILRPCLQDILSHYFKKVEFLKGAALHQIYDKGSRSNLDYGISAVYQSQRFECLAGDVSTICDHGDQRIFSGTLIVTFWEIDRFSSRIVACHNAGEFGCMYVYAFRGRKFFHSSKYRLSIGRCVDRMIRDAEYLRRMLR